MYKFNNCSHVCISSCTTVLHSTTQSSSDNFSSWPPDNCHSSGAVCKRGGGRLLLLNWCICVGWCMCADIMTILQRQWGKFQTLQITSTTISNSRTISCACLPFRRVWLVLLGHVSLSRAEFSSRRASWRRYDTSSLQVLSAFIAI